MRQCGYLEPHKGEFYNPKERNDFPSLEGKALDKPLTTPNREIFFLSEKAADVLCKIQLVNIQILKKVSFAPDVSRDAILFLSLFHAF